ncbi:antitoxin Xre/MbcA/ParS toxin-binding domain-containing protein [Pseudomonas sp. G.S.17]|uniref:antitoxin Xre/MbcA/ParS toxin-binding domain-containing protein n=1 Tax=Pseudomonas sp. G.S.17 TaxID=3137451 RepID=UPI00311CBE3D
MFAEVLGESAYGVYRSKLELLLQIPVHATGQQIHHAIETGFPASTVQTLCDIGSLDSQSRDTILPLETLRSRLARGQRLTVAESDRLFRICHILATMAALFAGNDDKSERWLKQPHVRLSGKCPLALLSTTVGTSMVEELLIQATEGFNF